MIALVQRTSGGAIDLIGVNPQQAALVQKAATRWSLAAGVPLVLMRVVYPLVEPVARVPPTEEQLAQLGYVRGIALRLEGEGYRVVNVTVQHASAPDAIVDLSADVPGALVAVSTANAGALVETIEGSTAAQILRGSSVPVIVARQT